MDHGLISQDKQKNEIPNGAVEELLVNKTIQEEEQTHKQFPKFRVLLIVFIIIILSSLGVGVYFFINQHSNQQSRSEIPEKTPTPAVSRQGQSSILYWEALEVSDKNLSYEDKYNYSLRLVSLDGRGNSKIIDGKPTFVPFSGDTFTFSESGNFLFLTVRNEGGTYDKSTLWLSDKKGNKKKLEEFSDGKMAIANEGYILSSDGSLVAYSVGSYLSEQLPSNSVRSLEKVTLVISRTNDSRIKEITSEAEAVIGVINGQPKTISSKKGQHIIPLKFSGDNSKLLALISMEAPGEQAENLDVAVVDINTGQIQRLGIQYPPPSQYITFSPDDKKVLRWSHRSRKGDMYVSNLSDGSSKKLLEKSNIDGLVGWISPTQIVYYESEGSTDNKIPPPSSRNDRNPLRA